MSCAHAHYFSPVCSAGCPCCTLDDISTADDLENTATPKLDSKDEVGQMIERGSRG